jgi:hypothetical protein
MILCSVSKTVTCGTDDFMWFNIFRIEQIELEKWSVAMHFRIVPLCLLSKNINIIMLRTCIFLHVVLYGFQTWPLNLKKIQTENLS